MQNDSRNTIVFVVLAAIILIGYQTFILGPSSQKKAAELKAQQKAVAEAQVTAPTADSAPKILSRDAAKALSPRVAVDTPALAGSLRLQGARIDDLFLKGYRETLAKDSPFVELFRPEGAEHAWFAEFGWTGQNVPGLPTPDTVWTVKAGDVLAPGRPVVLTYTATNGLEFTRTVSVDKQFMFTVQDTVANTSGMPITIAPYATVQRQGLHPTAAKGQNVHEGAIGVLSNGDEGAQLRLRKYKDWQKKEAQTFASTGGWLGITDKYWLAALIPNQSEKIAANSRVTKSRGVDIYDTNFVGAARTIPAGGRIVETTRLFAGAKVVQTLQAYERTLGIPNFDKAVDWGMLWFFTRPFFMALEFIFGLVGNFGVAILAVTLLVRLILFPLAHKSYESMSRMKKLQKPMEEIKARYKDDPTKMQQETMALYQREKVNPIAGCLPILLQIPIFLAFYKVLSVTIEMRHAPFFGYIRDLSAPEPNTILNLFGLIPWDVASTPLIGGIPALVHLGPLPLLYGFTMWLTTAMNPPAPDPMQQRIFQLMPILFTFIMASFPTGLLLYWTFSNVFSIFQQYIIMHRLKVENPIDDFLNRFRSGDAKAVS